VERLRAHPKAMTLLAFVLAAVAVLAIAAAYGFGGFGRAWSHVHGWWILLALAGTQLAMPAYAIAYRALIYFGGSVRLTLSLALRLVGFGFGPFLPGGGFAADQRALRALHGDERSASVTVLGLGALEWALLAPAAWLAALLLLVTGDHRPLGSLLWPWAVAVPLGFALGLWAAAPSRRERLRPSGWQDRLRRALRGVGILPGLARESRCRAAWLGMALYWSLDIAGFYGALRFIGPRLNLGEVVLAYATGYALTRRSMPLGGAGVTEALMTFALHWTGLPVLPALAAVVVYRVFNFVLPAVPAFIVRARVRPLLRTAEWSTRQALGGGT
jgi:uncharacterized membrane protein YbhN (UPF0104 family)